MKLQFCILVIIVASFISLTKQETDPVAKPSNLLSLVEAIINDPEFLALTNRQQIQILLRIYLMLENFLKSNYEKN